MVCQRGIEPPTYRLKVDCSTDWATGTYILGGSKGIEPFLAVSQTAVLTVTLTTTYIGAYGWN